MGIANLATHTTTLIGKTIREDLSDIITMISPYDTPFFSMLQSVAATSTKHEWLTDDLKATDGSGALEGNDWEGVALTTPTRVTNQTQILRKDFAVTGSNETVSHAGMASQFSYQTMKALRELARNTERALLCGTAEAAGDATTVRTMKGLAPFVANATRLDASTGAVGATLDADEDPGNTTLTEPMFNTLLQTMWELGAAPDTCLVSPGVKKDISAFVGASIARFNVGKNELVKNVMQYESDFGTVDIILDRFTPVGAAAAASAATGTIVANDDSVTGFAFERQHVRKAILRPTTAERLPKNGDAERGMVLHELTLEVASADAVGMWANVSA